MGKVYQVYSSVPLFCCCCFFYVKQMQKYQMKYLLKSYILQLFDHMQLCQNI